MKQARPTSGLVLQALFNILGPGDGRSFLDLFSGTGRVGAEACRRGFCPVVLVDSSRKGLPGTEGPGGLKGTEFLGMDIRRALLVLEKRGRPFDVIFADPPYGIGWVARMASLNSRLSGIMKAKGLFVLEHSRREAIDPAGWKGWDPYSRTYGETLLTFFSKKTKGEGEKP